MAYPDTPPPRVSSDPNHKDFHPSYLRIGIMFDGVERNDVARYDAAAVAIWLTTDKKGPPVMGRVEPFWRWTEGRQERRARERWDAAHGGRT